MSRLGLLPIVFVLWHVSQPQAYAQLLWGGLRGEVTDLSGAPIPSAWIGLSSPSFSKGTSTITDLNGRYVFPVLPVGSYTVAVSAPGFHTLRYTLLEVRVGQQAQFNARLSLGAVTESVEVTDSLQALDTAARTVTTITASDFDHVARGRSVHTLLMMAPGVRHEARSGASGVGGISVDGASGSENTYFIDGVEVTDVVNGALRQQNSVPAEFVKAMQVQSGGFEAEFGGATGGVISVATRSGSNEIHGEGLLGIMSGALNAGDRGYWQRSPFDPARAEFFRPRKDDYRIIYPGFSLGGPLLRNRLFAYASYMPEFETTNRYVNYVDGARSWTSQRRRHYALSRVDASPLARLQLNAAWIWSPVERKGPLGTRDIRLKVPIEISDLREVTPAQTFSLAATYSVSAHTLISVRYGWKYLNARTNNYGLSGLPYFLYKTPSPQGIPDDLAAGAGYQSATGAYVVDKDITARHNLYFDASRVVSIFGQQHIIKAGYGFNRVFNDVSDRIANGRFDIYWGESFSRGSVLQQRGAYGYYIWEDGPRLDSLAMGQNYAAYVQDTWRALPRLTISMGVRLEREHLPPYGRGFTSSQVKNPVDFGWGDKIAPRLGAAWDVLGDGRWKLSGSFGLFYDTMKYNMARAAFGGTQWFSHVYRLDNPDLMLLNTSNPGILGEKIASWNNLQMPVNENGEWQGIDPDLRPFTSREITFALERRITSRLNASVRFTNKTLLRTIEDIGVLNENESEVYLIGNPGFGLTRNPQSIYGRLTPDGGEWLVPRATRNYNGLEFRLQGQISNYNVIASYTLSRLYGNFAGLANSDEGGRMDPSLSRSFDLPTYYFDSSGTQRNVEGRLATDRPHAFKLFGWKEIPNRFGTTAIGLTQVAMSGTPDSTTVVYLTAPTFPNGRGDLGRTPFYTQTDLNLTHTIRIHERASIRLEATAMNVFNQAAVTSRVSQLNRQGAITSQELPLDQFFSGYRVSDFVRPGRTTGAAWNPLYGLPGGDPVDGGVAWKSGRSDLSSAFLAQNPVLGAYQGPRTLRLGIRLVF